MHIKHKIIAGILAVVTAATPVASYAAEIQTLEMQPGINLKQQTENKFLFVTLKTKGGSVILNKDTVDQQVIKLDYHNVKVDESGKTEKKLFIEVYDKDEILLFSEEAEKNKNTYMYEVEADKVVTVDAVADEGYGITGFEGTEGEVEDKLGEELRPSFTYPVFMDEDAKVSVKFGEIPKEEAPPVEAGADEKTGEEDLTVEQTEAAEDEDSVEESGDDETEADDDLTVSEDETDETEDDLTVSEGEEVENEADLTVSESEADEVKDNEADEDLTMGGNEDSDNLLEEPEEQPEAEEDADADADADDNSLLTENNAQPEEHFADFTEEIYTLDSEQFETARLVIMTDSADDIVDKEHLIASYDNIYLMQYKTVEQAMNAYLYYESAVRAVEPDTAVEMAEEDVEGTVPTDETSIEVTEEMNPLAILSETENTSLTGKVVALIDTGVSNGINIINRVSMIDDDTEGTNQHGNHMVEDMVSQNPDIQILSVRAMGDDGRGTVSSIVAGMEYAMEQGVDIINLSLYAKSNLSNSVLLKEIEKAVDMGIDVVAAAGNDGADVVDYTPGSSEYAWVIGAANEDGTRLEGSNYGSTVDYNVVADTTSEAAAKFSGYISKYGTIGITVNEGLIFATDYISEGTGGDIEAPPVEPENPDTEDDLYHGDLMEGMIPDDDNEIWQIEGYPEFSYIGTRYEKVWTKDAEFNFDTYRPIEYSETEVIAERQTDVGTTDVEFTDGTSIELFYKYTLIDNPDYYWYEYVNFAFVENRDFATTGSVMLEEMFPDYINQDRNEGYGGIVPDRKGSVVAGKTYTVLANDSDFEVDGLLLDYNPYTFKVNRMISDDDFDVTKTGSYKVVYEMSHFMYPTYTWILESTVNVVEPETLEAGIYLTSKESTLMFNREDDGLYGGYGDLVKLNEGSTGFILSCIDAEYEVTVESSDSTILPEEICTIMDLDDNKKLLSINAPSVDKAIILSVLRPGYHSPKMFMGGGWQPAGDLSEGELNNLSEADFAAYEDTLSGEAADDDLMKVAETWTTTASTTFGSTLQTGWGTGHNYSGGVQLGWCTNYGTVNASNQASAISSWAKKQNMNIAAGQIPNFEINCSSGHDYWGMPVNTKYNCTIKAYIQKDSTGKQYRILLTAWFNLGSSYQEFYGTKSIPIDRIPAKITLHKRFSNASLAEKAERIEPLETTFGIYSNKNCTKDSLEQTIRVKSDGYKAVGSCELDQGKYWMKEIHRIGGCILNTDLYGPFSVKWGETKDISDIAEGAWIKDGYIYNKPVWFRGEIATKIDADTNGPLKDAIFLVEYSAHGGDNFKTAAKWYFKTDENGKFYYDDKNLVNDSKHKSDELWRVTDGRAALPVGTLQVTEVEAPEGYELDPKAYRVNIEPQKDANGEYTIISAKLSKNLKIKNKSTGEGWPVRVNVKKVDKDLNGLSGAEFAIYDNKECTGDPLKILISGKDGMTDIYKYENIPDTKEEFTLYCKEVKAPDGYAIIDTVFNLTFKKSDFDALSDEEKLEGELKTFGPEDGIVNEDGWKIRVNAKKVKENLSPLADAEFGVYLDNKCEGTPVGILKSGADGMTNILEITAPMDKDKFTVYCKEINAPSGYALNKEVYQLTFNKDEYDKLAEKGDTSGELQTFGPADGNGIVNKEGWKVRVQLKKVDDKGNPLEGAVFDVYDDEGLTHSVGQLTSGADGMSNILTVAVDMDADEIMLYCKETTAPTGYELLTEVESLNFTKIQYNVEVDNGNLEGELQQFGPKTGIVNKPSTTPTPTPPPGPSDGDAGLYIKKTSTVDPEILELNGYSLAGGEFSVTSDRADGGSGTLTTREDGISDSLALPDNHKDVWHDPVYDANDNLLHEGYWEPKPVATNYTIKETKPPKGHQMNYTPKYQRVVMPDDKNKTFEIPFEDEPIFCKNKLDIEKLGSKGNPIEGVVFKVELFDSPSGESGNPVKTWYLESDKNGKIYLDDAHITHRLSFQSDPFFMHKGKIVIPIDCYLKFTEVAAPAEYIINDKPFGLPTGEDAELSYRAYNEPQPCEVKIKKYEADGSTPITGVEFEIKFLEEAIHANENKHKNFKRLLEVGETYVAHTDENGELIFKNLDQGKYQITEIKTETGHGLLKDPIIVTLPMTMTTDEANEYGNIDWDKGKNDVSYTDKWFFYSCLYEITNNANLVMPMSGGLGDWKYGFIGMGIIAMIGTSLIVHESLNKKRRKTHKRKKHNIDDFKI